MKKHGWLVLSTMILFSVFAFCLLIQHRSANQAEVDLPISFRVFSDQSFDTYEEIKCWKQDNNRYFVFLPSYAEPSRIIVHISSQNQIQLGRFLLTEGMTLEHFALETEYEFAIDGNSTKSLQFVQSANIATIYISTESGSMDQIHADKSHKEQAEISVYTADGLLDYHGDNTDQIRGRGNSTWEKYDKKPYNLYLQRSFGLLNMPAAKKWVLLANAVDETNLRNRIIYDVANEMNIRGPQSKYIDLYINGEYYGLYLLCEKLENVAAQCLPNEACTFFCLNNRLPKLDDPNKAIFVEEQQLYAEIVSPSEYTEDEAVRLRSFLSLVEETVSTDAWKDHIDIYSFARKYLIDEVFTNMDGGLASEYLFWDHSSNKLFAGPCWDYDASIGNIRWNKWITPEYMVMQDRLLYGELFKHEEFRTLVNQIYLNEFITIIENLIEKKIPALTEKIGKAANNNRIRWASVYSGQQSDPTFLSDFLSNRMHFLNSLWIKKSPFCKISFQTRGYSFFGEPEFNSFLPLYVPQNSSNLHIPSPEDFGIKSTNMWYRDDNNEPFDIESVITEDLTLYVSADPSPPGGSIILTIFSLGIIILLIVSLGLNDYHNYQRRRIVHGRKHSKVSS